MAIFKKNITSVPGITPTPTAPQPTAPATESDATLSPADVQQQTQGKQPATYYNTTSPQPQAMSAPAPSLRLNNNGPTLSEGDTIAQYKVIRCLGIGGMGEVYLVKHTLLDTTCAIKLLKQDIAANHPELVKQFILEAKIASDVRHPNLIGVSDAYFDQQSGLAFIIMEYIDGCSVSKLMKSRPISLAETFNIAMNICQALDAINKAHITHRDLKPGNIMISRNGDIKLADLGIAKIAGQNNNIWNQNAGDNFATPAYASPEQLQKLDIVDYRSDIYSLGATLYHIITGHKPFDGPIPSIVTNNAINNPPKSILEYRPDIKKEYVKIIDWMMEKDPEKRPQNLSMLIELFKAAFEAEQHPSLQHTNALKAQLRKNHLMKQAWLDSKIIFGFMKKLVKPAIVLIILGVLFYFGQMLFPRVKSTVQTMFANTAPTLDNSTHDVPGTQPENVAAPAPSTALVSIQDDEDQPPHVIYKDFLDAVREGNAAKTLLEFIKNEPPLDLVDAQGNTPIILAAKAGSLAVLRYLTEKKYNLYAPDTNGNTALHIVIPVSHDISLVDFIMNSTVQTEIFLALSKPNRQGSNPVHLAAANNKVNLLPAILYSMPLLNLEDTDANGLTAMEIAATNNNLPAVEFLASRRAKVTSKALELAATDEMKKLLLSCQK